MYETNSQISLVVKEILSFNKNEMYFLNGKEGAYYLITRGIINKASDICIIKNAKPSEIDFDVDPNTLYLSHDLFKKLGFDITGDVAFLTEYNLSKDEIKKINKIKKKKYPKKIKMEFNGIYV